MFLFDRSRSSNRIKESGGSHDTHQRAYVLFDVVLLIVLAFSVVSPLPVRAQGIPNATPTPAGNETPIAAPDRVEIEPTARDEEIRARIKSILEATGWFQNPEVEVQEGVVFLAGRTETTDHRSWAGDLARNTQDVVAVVNQIELTEPSIWDFQPAITELRELWVGLIRSFPLIAFSLFVILVTWVITQFVVAKSRKFLRQRLSTTLLSNVAAYAIGLVVFLIGLFIILQVAGLTSVAMTVVGGTGLLGLVLGIAFRDITENFLASIFLSLQNPFRTGDLVEIMGILGYVQTLNTRVTVLMTLDGNHVQIPNSTVYKSNIYNYTSSPSRRVDFLIGIGYQDVITSAQETALKVLENHPAVLKDPEPWILVESLGSATVNLRIYFWLDGNQHSWLKVQSSVIRLVKKAFQEERISMPDEAREMIFPEGVQVQLLQPEVVGQSGMVAGKPRIQEKSQESDLVSTKAEAGLRSESSEIQEQALNAWTPEEGENLLKSPENKDKK